MSQTRALVLISHQGLCNRLKVLLSGLVVAETTHRAFTMHWTPTRTCAARFDQLFQNAWNITPERAAFADDALDFSLTPWDKFPDLLASTKPNLKIQHFGWLLRPALYPHHAPYMAQCAKKFVELEPRVEIQERIESFQQQFFRARMVGVHLRRGDFVTARPNVVNNLSGAMDALERFLAQAPNAGIFLCTDDGAPHASTRKPTRAEGVAARFVERFGERVVSTTPRTLDRDKPEAIQDALVDLWLLRRTDYFVGTHASSFSEMASWGRAIPTVLTSAPLPHYQPLEQFFVWSGIQRILNRIGTFDNEDNVPLTSVWYSLKHRLGAKRSPRT